MGLSSMIWPFPAGTTSVRLLNFFLVHYMHIGKMLSQSDLSGLPSPVTKWSLLSSWQGNVEWGSVESLSRPTNRQELAFSLLLPSACQSSFAGFYILDDLKNFQVSRGGGKSSCKESRERWNQRRFPILSYSVLFNDESIMNYVQE